MLTESSKVQKHLLTADFESSTVLKVKFLSHSRGQKAPNNHKGTLKYARKNVLSNCVLSLMLFTNGRCKVDV